jgi:hypothetical protein
VEKESVGTVKAQAAERGIRIRLLCDNAAFGRVGRIENAVAEGYAALALLSACDFRSTERSAASAA